MYQFYYPILILSALVLAYAAMNPLDSPWVLMDTKRTSDFQPLVDATCITRGLSPQLLEATGSSRVFLSPEPTGTIEDVFSAEFIDEAGSGPVNAISSSNTTCSSGQFFTDDYIQGFHHLINMESLTFSQGILKEGSTTIAENPHSSGFAPPVVIARQYVYVAKKSEITESNSAIIQNSADEDAALPVIWTWTVNSDTSNDSYEQEVCATIIVKYALLQNGVSDVDDAPETFSKCHRSKKYNNYSTPDQSLHVHTSGLWGTVSVAMRKLDTEDSGVDSIFSMSFRSVQDDASLQSSGYVFSASWDVVDENDFTDFDDRAFASHLVEMPGGEYERLSCVGTRCLLNEKEIFNFKVNANHNIVEIIDIIDQYVSDDTWTPKFAYRNPWIIFRVDAAVYAASIRFLSKVPLISDMPTTSDNPTIVYRKALAPHVHRDLVHAVPLFSTDPSFAPPSAPTKVTVLPFPDRLVFSLHPRDGMASLVVLLNLDAETDVRLIGHHRGSETDWTVKDERRLCPVGVSPGDPSVPTMVDFESIKTSSAEIYPALSRYATNSFRIPAVDLWDSSYDNSTPSGPSNPATWETQLDMDCPLGTFKQRTGRCAACPEGFMCPGDNNKYTCNGISPSSLEFVGMHRCPFRRLDGLLTIPPYIGEIDSGLVDFHVTGLDFEYHDNGKIVMIYDFTAPGTTMPSFITNNHISTGDSDISIIDDTATPRQYQARIVYYFNENAAGYSRTVRVSVGSGRAVNFEAFQARSELPGSTSFPSIKTEFNSVECEYKGDVGATSLDSNCPSITNVISLNQMKGFKLSHGAEGTGHRAGVYGIPYRYIAIPVSMDSDTVSEEDYDNFIAISPWMPSQAVGGNRLLKLPQTEGENNTFVISQQYSGMLFKVNTSSTMTRFYFENRPSSGESGYLTLRSVVSSSEDLADELVSNPNALNEMETEDKQNVAKGALRSLVDRKKDDKATNKPSVDDVKKMVNMVSSNKDMIASEDPKADMEIMTSIIELVDKKKKEDVLTIAELGAESLKNSRNKVNDIGNQTELTQILDSSVTVAKGMLESAKNTHAEMDDAQKKTMRKNAAEAARSVARLAVPIAADGTITEKEITPTLKVKSVRLPPPAANAKTSKNVSSDISDVTKGLEVSISGANVTGSSIAIAVTVSSDVDMFGAESVQGTVAGKQKHLISPVMSISVDGASSFDMSGVDFSAAHEKAISLRRNGVIENKKKVKTSSASIPIFMGSVSSVLTSVTETLFGWMMPDEGGEKVSSTDIAGGIQISAINDSGDWEVQPTASVTAVTDDLKESNLSGLDPDSLAGGFACWMAEEGISVNLEPFTKPFEYAQNIPDHPQAFILCLILALIYVVLFILFLRLDRARTNKLKQFGLGGIESVSTAQDVELADRESMEDSENNDFRDDSEDSLADSPRSNPLSTNGETDKKIKYGFRVKRRFRRAIKADHSTVNLISDPFEEDLKFLRRKMPRTQKLTCYLALIMVAWVCAAMFYNTDCSPGSTEPLECEDYSTGQTLLIGLISAVIAAFTAGLVAFLFGHTYLEGEAEGEIPYFDEQRAKLMRKLKPDTTKKLNGFMRFFRALSLPFARLNLALSKIRFPHWMKYVWYVLAGVLTLGCAFIFCLYSVYFGMELGNKFVWACLLTVGQDIFIIQPLKVVAIAFVGPLVELIDVFEALS